MNQLTFSKLWAARKSGLSALSIAIKRHEPQGSYNGPDIWTFQCITTL